MSAGREYSPFLEKVNRGLAERREAQREAARFQPSQPIGFGISWPGAYRERASQIIPAVELPVRFTSNPEPEPTPMERYFVPGIGFSWDGDV